MRKISKEKYVIAAFLTAGIFLLGLFLGFVIEGKRVSYIQSVSEEQRLDFSSLQLQYAYIDQLNRDKDCNAVIKTSEKYLENLEATRIKLETYTDNSKLNQRDFDILKREYIIAQLNYWLLAKKTKDLCNSDSVSILYFFSTEDKCPNCDQQAFILTYLKKIFKEKLLIFALDSEYTGESMLDILKNRYDVVTFPTLIIEEKKLESLVSKDKILKEICPRYTSEIETCLPYTAQIK